MVHTGSPAHRPLRSTQPAEDEGTLFGFGVGRLRSLCEAVRFERRDEIVDLFRLIAMSWADRSVLDPPSWPSTVGDDETPVEFSIALGAAPELRVLVEPLGHLSSLASNAEAASALLESLSAHFDIDLSRFERVRDLFVPRTMTGAFVMWVAAGLSPVGEPKFKLYLNPFIQGEHRAPALIEEALARLGFDAGWDAVTTGIARRGQELDELMYFSLDLAKSNEARVKVYARHRRCSIADLEAAASISRGYRAGDVAEFIRTVGPEVVTTFDARAPLTCYAFSTSGGPRPESATTHFPISGYAPNDEAVRQRVVAYLEHVGIPLELYTSALAGFANRALDGAIGMQSYVSFRRDRGKPRVTIYFPVEAYRPGRVASTPRVIAPRRPSGHRRRQARP